MAWTFSMVCVAWVFFRAESVGEALGYLAQTLSLPSNAGQSINELVKIRSGSGSLKSLENLVLIAFPFIEWTKGRVQLKSETTGVVLRAVKWIWMGVLIVLIIQFGISHQVETFIYFQF